MIAPLRGWDRFWFGPTSAKPLAAFRIAFGLIALLHLALLAPDVDTWLSDAGYLRGSEARELAGPWRPSPLQHWQSPPAARGFVVATAAVAVAVTLGWRTRLMAVLLYLGLLSIHHRNLLTASGADVMLVAMAFYLMLSPCGAALSLDARRAAQRRGTPAEPLIAPWAQRLMQIQVSVIYFLTAALKANGASWLDGTALHYVLSNGEARRFTFGLTEAPLATASLTYAVLVIEFALAFLLWVRAARPWVIAAGIALHLGITATVNIPIFAELMMASYLTFLTPAEFASLARCLTSWRRAKVDVDADPPRRLRGPHRPVAATEPSPREETERIEGIRL